MSSKLARHIAVQAGAREEEGQLIEVVLHHLGPCAMARARVLVDL